MITPVETIPMTRSFTQVLSAALLVASAGAVTFASEPADANPLSGPKVEDRSAPGVNPTLDGAQRDRRRAGGERNRPMLFVGAVMSLSKPETPEALRLTDDQRAKAEAIGKEYADAMRAFRDQHREEFEALRDGRGRAPRDGERGGRGGERPERPQEMTPEQQKKASELRALMEQAPKPEPYQARLWALLSPEQQTVATERLNQMKSRADDEMRDRARERSPDNQRERRGRRNADAPPPPENPGRPGGQDGRPPRAEREFDQRDFRADGRLDRRPGFAPPPPGEGRRVTLDDLRARLDRLPPEQRERVLRRMMETLDRLEERAPRDRPAPPMREIDVPPGA